MRLKTVTDDTSWLVSLSQMDATPLYVQIWLHCNLAWCNVMIKVKCNAIGNYIHYSLVLPSQHLIPKKQTNKQYPADLKIKYKDKATKVWREESFAFPCGMLSTWEAIKAVCLLHFTFFHIKDLSTCKIFSVA